jgi:heptosyltransferase-2
MFDMSCKSLLVRGVNWVGDAVMTLPALRALRSTFKGARISLLVKPWVSPIFEHNPDIDEIVLYEDGYKGIIGKVKLSRLLKKKKFCGAILFQNAFDAALVTFLARIKERAGYKRDGRGILLTIPVTVPRSEKKEHQIYYYLKLLSQLGIDAHYSDPYIYLTIDERLHARDILKSMKRPILGINPGATFGSAKRWFPERFAEIANWFIKDTGGSVVIFGAPSEVPITQEIEYFMKKQESDSVFLSQHLKWKQKNGIDGSPQISQDSLFNMAGKTSLRELIDFISECDVFVTNDSGPMHIAYAVKTPLVALFGSTDPQLTGPPPAMHRNNSIAVSPELQCSPCFERTCRNNDMRCMYAITTDDVYYSIKKVLPRIPAVFFDRDGTLCKDTGYINTFDNLSIFSEIDTVKLLKDKGFKLIGVTNQSGIARGIVNEDFVKEVNKLFIKQYGFDNFYYCPHHPDEHCMCRKPEPGMLLRAREEYGINLKKSYVVGDKEADMVLANAVGAKGVLVRTGEAKESQHADFIAGDLAEAVYWIAEKVS